MTVDQLIERTGTERALVLRWLCGRRPRSVQEVAAWAQLRDCVREADVAAQIRAVERARDELRAVQS